MVMCHMTVLNMTVMIVMNSQLQEFLLFNKCLIMTKGYWDAIEKHEKA